MRVRDLIRSISITAAFGLIGIPLIVSTAVSCSATGTTDKNQNNKLPEQPLIADTSNITTFADALKFSNDFLTKNYNFEMFKSDVNKYVDYYKTLSQKNGVNLICNISYTKNAKNSLNIDTSWITESTEMKQSIVSNFTNVKILPILINNGNKINVKLLATFNPRTSPGYSTGETNPNVLQENWIYDNLQILKEQNQDYKNKTVLEYQITNNTQLFSKQFIINKSDLNLLKSKIFTNESISYLFGNNTISMILDMEYCQLTFNNIQDINANMYQENNQNTPNNPINNI